VACNLIFHYGMESLTNDVTLDTEYLTGKKCLKLISLKMQKEKSTNNSRHAEIPFKKQFHKFDIFAFVLL